jgi:nucleoside 2-deoxyribosyltransferase
MLIAMSYVVGHGVTSIGDTIVLPFVERVVRVLTRLKLVVPKRLVPSTELFKRIQQGHVFRAFHSEAIKLLPSLSSAPKEEMTFTAWRNIAMSIASAERNTVWRFMFISLLNQGIATVLLLLVVFQISLHGFAPFRIDAAFALPAWLFSGLLILASLPFLERRYVFYRIAMELPFGMALIALRQAKEEGATPVRESQTRDRVTIYLAGGFPSGWQDRVKEAAPQFRYLDPRSHRLHHKERYTMWDLEAIRRSDWIFAYLEASNPGGYALAVEIGYAKALGKRIVLINEKRGVDAGDRHFEMLSAASDVEVSTLSEGIEFLKKLETVV